MHCLHFLLFVSTVQLYFPFGACQLEEQFLRRNDGNATETEGSGEEGGEQILISESTASSPATSTISVSTSTVPSTVSPSTSIPLKPVRCYDISKKCTSIKALCVRDEYRSIMVRQCAKTCDACDQFSRLPPAARCRDSFHSCPTWADNGFCHSTYYTLDERKDFCRKSCEDC